MDNFSLFAANAIILFVFAAAFYATWLEQPDARYWKSWAVANLLLGVSLIFFMAEPHLPASVIVVAPNGLLILGFTLRWCGAREFAGREMPLGYAVAPFACFAALCAVPWFIASYGAVYTVVNLILAILALGTAAEFFRDRRDGLLSRYGLVFSYSLMGLSFALRVLQGILEGNEMAYQLPDDMMLVLHLVVALVYTSSSGAFSLTIAYERNAAEQREAALRDPLTGVYNRRDFENRLHTLLEDDKAPRFAIVQFDIDHFKQVNDRFGHAAGDKALRLCASAIRDALRPQDCLARLGGEEFAALLVDIEREEAARIADRVREAVSAIALDVTEDGYRLTVSAGIYHAGSSHPDFDAVMKIADDCLYLAKNRGRDRIELSPAAA
ncbi:diguanylate cyclase [Stappia sp. GBMRC 2046]|uniref:diguanylate cyclase n=1 Tax=Stappia sediminis TaxID=2692190 RepID=A0A7X3LR57_9HYPH|nr:GGDEF domain-containing protein [Stappia sediminis]MXN63574.1 diguanylate cyclase [Stappia sediminis]